MRNYCSLILIVLLSCTSKPSRTIDAQFVIDKAIENSGKEKLNNATLQFNFRDYVYISKGKCDSYEFTRLKASDSLTIKDVFDTQKGHTRYISERKQRVPDSIRNNIIESINSINYFIQLPFKLNDIAVNKTYLGIDSLNGKQYHNVKITFQEENGGTDFQDVYMYWFDTETYKMDFLAYSFVVNDGGIRFREAYNERIIEGIRFVDYKNYKPKDKKITLSDISKAYSNNELELLSKIENKNISVIRGEKKCY